ncbi:MAG: hypothetical protein CR997_09205 [Acidobacteria bacterium]|nr:MAG: hypothetical protein CR997_09205 [Acidobacteriota bacterium]
MPMSLVYINHFICFICKYFSRKDPEADFDQREIIAPIKEGNVKGKGQSGMWFTRRLTTADS